ncbi:LPXTG cell wall anchor domain-containing protein [Streptomyces sp. SID2999]|nr:LPXTG cell wall anchor domain-containing protein [Streptomyces sp. SID2999]
MDDDLTTSLSGLPSKIVAGSGFHGFKLNVKNSGKHTYKRVDLGVFAAAMGEEDFSDATRYLTLQYQDPTSGKWNDISVDLDDEAAGYLGYTDVQAKESFSIDLRLSVDKKAPAGAGFAISIGSYVDDEGNCVYASDDDIYEFDILAAGTTPGPVDDSTPKPQGGSKPLPSTKPAGNTQVVPQGHLAETGAGSALPVIALTGGAVVALGVGAVFVVRRRRNEGGNVAV